MAGGKNKRGKSSSVTPKKSNKTMAVGSKAAKDGQSSSSISYLVPILVVIGAILYKSQYGSSDEIAQSLNTTDPTAGHRKMKVPVGWQDGFYTIEDVVTVPSTHATLYPNGGNGPGETVTIESDKDFLDLGRVYNDMGQIVQSRTHFKNGASLYLGPTRAGTHFQWPAVALGHRRPVSGVYGGDGKQVELETLTEPTENAASSEPRVFYVHNFLSAAEADEFVKFSTAPENPYKMAPSTGGTHKAWNQGGDGAVLTTRTSENAFDITTKQSFDVKKRAFRLLRMNGYQENMADGIQILRYKVGQAYVAHHDYFPTHQSKDFNWDPLSGGSNRFATIFLYLSDVSYGGQTVFPNCEKLSAEKSPELVERLGESPSASELKEFVSNAGLMEGSWEDNLIHKCYEKFAVPPRRGDAILFYSQRPDGLLDTNSLHGACPILNGTKWGANLWVWNACRYSQCSEDPMLPSEELTPALKAPFPGGSGDI